MIVLPEPTLLNFIAAGVGLYIVKWLLVNVRRWWRHFKARRFYNRYQDERDTYYGTGGSSAPRHTATRQNHDYIQPEEAVKDEDVRVQDMVKPKGFWTKLVMGEKMNLIREMIRISNSAEHKGYWQDRVEAQKRVEGQRHVGDEQGR